MNILGIDFNTFPVNYSDAYAALTIFGEAQNSIDARLSPNRFYCHMNDFMYIYLAENSFNCGMKFWARHVWYRYLWKICLLGKTDRKTSALLIKKLVRNLKLTLKSEFPFKNYQIYPLVPLNH